MKRIFLSCLLLALFLSGYSQQNFIIEVHVDGNSIMPSDTIVKPDVEWSMKLLPGGEVINHSHAYTLWNSRTAFLLIIDLSDFATYKVGDQVEISFAVTNPNHKYYDYAGQRTYAITQTTEPEAFYGGQGINLKRRPSIEVHDTTLCAAPGQEIPAIVRYAPEGYRVLWPDSLLTGLPGDKALVGTSFSADSVYDLSAILTDGNGLPLDTAFFKLSFDTLPEVNIIEDDFCLAKGDPLVVNGVIPANSEHQWVSTENRQRSAMPGSVPTQYSTVMQDQNLKIVLAATSRTTGCRNSDSVYIYLRPDKPLISIDTNTTRHNLKISWIAGDTVSGYTLWSNKWDAYGIQSSYSAKEVLGQGVSSYVINTGDLDTLEFFYLTADQKNGGRRVCQTVSDTVGYKLDYIHFNTNPMLTSNNLISWMFDMTAVNVKTSADVFDRLYTDISALRRWNMATQKYIATQKNPAFGKVPNAPKYINIFDLNIGITLQVAALKECKLLQYGVLPPKVQYTLVKSGTGTHNNQFGLALHKIGLKNTSDVFKQLTTDNIAAVRVWNFSAQQWEATLKNPVFGKVPGALEFIPIYNVKVGTPLQLPLKESKTSYIWK